jgi:thiol-disulfide isomerase/thioredoxin
MKELYERYKDVVVVVSVSCVQKSADVWRRAVERLGMPWINVFSDSISEIELEYGVGSYPTKLLLDPDGKILLRTMLHQIQQISEELENIFGRGDTAQRVAVGTVAPDFMLRDINGRQFRLSSLRGKYVLINFWGTWCAPCVRGIPRMKQVYERFQDKLEIVGVATREESVADWRAGVKRLELPWINVYNDNVSAIHTRYGITGYPTKLLICPNGTVLVRETGTQGSFYTRLEYILLSDDLTRR